MINVADLAITSLDVISAYNLDGTPAFVLDELQDATISNTEEKEEVTGRGGRRLSSLKKNKGVTVSGTNGLVSAGLLETQVGDDFVQANDAAVKWIDYLTVKNNAATTEWIAAGTAGAEIEALYVRGADGTAGTQMTQASAVASGKFTYNPTTKALAFNENELEDGTEIIVYYTRKLAAHVLTNDSTNYSRKLRLYIDGSAEDKCGNIYHVQFLIPKADFNGEFDLELGDTQAVHSFEAESLAGSVCGSGAASGALWTYTVFGVDAADYTGG